MGYRRHLFLQGTMPCLERGVTGAESAVPTTRLSGEKQGWCKGEEMILGELDVITVILEKG